MTIASAPLVEKLAEAIERSSRAKVRIETLRSAALESDSSFAGAADARDRLLAAIVVLEDQGLCRTPVSREHWEQMPTPALPHWVLKPAREFARRPVERPVTWHAQLGWAAAGYLSGRWTPVEAELLRAVNGFLIAGGPRRVVPLAERSLRLLGNEKALHDLSRGRLFAPGRLSLELLGAVRTPPPFVWTRLGDGPVLLVVENSATYWTLARARRDTGSPIGVLAFGAGNHFPAAVEYILDLPAVAAHPGLSEIRYFGDLDEEGLDIARRADSSARTCGLPDILPAVSLYERLLSCGVRGPGRVIEPSRAREVSRWLPEPLAGKAAQTLIDGLRIAQESVGTDELTDDPEWSSAVSLNTGTAGPR